MTQPQNPAITPEVIREHGLTPEEYAKIEQLLGGRAPTLTELGIFSVMWSEHCSYKSSRVHLKRLPTRSKLVLQTLDNFESVGPLAAWTGPLARGDFSTVERHVKALVDFEPEYLETYKTLSRLTAKVLAAQPVAMRKQLDRIYGAGAASK